MSLAAPGKLALLTLVAAGCITIIIVGQFRAGTETTPAWATLASIVGYCVGNGVGARRGEPQRPLFEPAHPEHADIGSDGTIS